jgi:hypothetical protein
MVKGKHTEIIMLFEELFGEKAETSFNGSLILSKISGEAEITASVQLFDSSAYSLHLSIVQYKGIYFDVDLIVDDIEANSTENEEGRTLTLSYGDFCISFLCKDHVLIFVHIYQKPLMSAGPDENSCMSIKS